ncbi:gp16 family protein [Hypericibacter sp.]|uniref:gp16 family protein n=1 Tax=Hypericibacter sp. TaxID=2705401 RepID=UPI003D6D0EF9
MHAQLKTDARRKMLSKIHIAKKDLALDDGTYRALLKRVTFKESSKACDAAELDLVIREFKRLGWKGDKPGGKRAGRRPMAQTDQASKIRALWLSLYHLGEVEDPSEDAMARFVTRMTGVEALQWLGPDQANIAIKALRGWCDRVGFLQPDAAFVAKVDTQRKMAGLDPLGPGFAAKIALMNLIWRKLIDAGAMKAGFFAKLETFLAQRVRQVGSPVYLTSEEADRAIEKLGAWWRREKPKADAKTEEKARE